MRKILCTAQRSSAATFRRFSAANDLRRLQFFCRVPRIYHQTGVGDDLPVVIDGVVGDDDDAVEGPEVVEWCRFEVQIVLSAAPYGWEEGVVIADRSSGAL